METFDARVLTALRADMEKALSPARFAHTLGVEETVARMARFFCPAKEGMLRAAALLHDSTKEYGREETDAVLLREGITLRPDEAASPAILHAITAPAEICRLYPTLATPALLSAVRWHTTGHAALTLTEALLYLADVIEEGREYPACAALRERFWGVDLSAMQDSARYAHLREVLIAALESSCESIEKRGGTVCEDTRNALLELKKNKTWRGTR